MSDDNAGQSATLVDRIARKMYLSGVAVTPEGRAEAEKTWDAADLGRTPWHDYARVALREVATYATENVPPEGSWQRRDITVDAAAIGVMAFAEHITEEVDSG